MNTNDILQLFVNPEDPQEFARIPFRHNGHLYATNRYIAVRVPDDASITDTCQMDDIRAIPGMAGRIDRWIATAQEDADFRKLVIPDAEWKQCRTCRGAKKFTTCKECDGEGDFIHGTYNYTCKKCDGDGAHPFADGETDCPDCNGEGRVLENVRIDNTLFNAEYLKTINKLPDLELWVNPVLDCSVFRFTGGHGVIMPMRG